MAFRDTKELAFPASLDHEKVATTGAVFEKGKMVSIDVTTGLLLNTVVGVAEDYVVGISLEDKTAAAGDLLKFRSGVFNFTNDASIDDTDVGKLCYATNNTTVSEDSATGTPAPAGTVYNVDSDGVWVKIDFPHPSAVALNPTP